MEELIKQNLKQFKLTYNSGYIQVQSLFPSFKTQILIDKKNSQIVFEKKGKAISFDNHAQVSYCSLILGILKIKDSSFLAYVDTVYQQPTLPPRGYSVYQIAAIDFISFKPKVDKQEDSILQTLRKEIFNFSFYFSFDRDLTQRNELFLAQRTNRPIGKFFWNEALLGNLMGATSHDEWLIPVIQGYYGKFETFLCDEKLTYYLISRRSKDRSGTRFYSRGIDEHGSCSNFIETEQTIVCRHYLASTVFISGSSPVFWEQKSQTKPIQLTRNKELTKGPFLEHLLNLNGLYGNVMLFNLLEKKKQGEHLLTQAYEQMLTESKSQIDSFCRYAYFDINDALKKKNHSEILSIVDRVKDIIQYFNCFVYNTRELKILAKQDGVFRISCLDCLNRTNVFMQAIAIKNLELQLANAQVPVKSLIQNLLAKTDDQLDTLIRNFKNLWLRKADYESLIYAGTRAASGLKDKFLDDLDSSLVAFQRLYNQKFMDRIKQTSIQCLHRSNKVESGLNGHNKNSSPLNVTILTWNVNATSPDKLNLKDIVRNFQGADLIAFGVQEMMELHPNNIVLEEEETKLSGLWEKAISEQLNEIKDCKYIFVQKIEMVGLCLILYISQKWKSTLRSVHKDTVKTGMGGTFGNKGGVVIRLKIYDTLLCFACAHLAAGETKTKERIMDFQDIHKKAFQQNKSGIQNQSLIQESQIKFFFGDLNFRLIGDFKDFSSLFQLDQKAKQPDYEQQVHRIIQQFVNRDQLLNEISNHDTVSLLTCYAEQTINFLPTYKLEKQTGKYTFEKNRNPSWCDRILYWADDRESHCCECKEYTALKVVGSDHRPVIGKFEVSILRSEPKVQPTPASTQGKQFRDTFLQSELV